MTDDPLQADDEDQAPLILTVTPDQAGQRLDKALALAAQDRPGLTRSRLATLVTEGHLTTASGALLTDPGRKVKAGDRFVLIPPPPRTALPRPQAIALDIVYEDADLIVVDKPAGMVVHPAPGAPDGTLVNALLHHCGPALTGIGGTARPGIVHRLDKDTSGLLVAAKTAAAQAGLALLFARHDIERTYLALAWGQPGALRVEAPIARHPVDRKRMAVVAGGRAAVTHFRVAETFGHGRAPTVSRLDCTLETGRTHQIRVHAAHLGCPLVGDPVYGRPRAVAPGALDPAARAALAAFPRQALHAAVLGFLHPTTGAPLRFEKAPPADLADLLAILRRNHDCARFSNT